MNFRIVFVLSLVCAVTAAGLLDVNLRAQMESKKEQYTMEMRGQFLYFVFGNWYSWLTKSDTLDFLRGARQIAKNKPSDNQRIEKLLEEFDHKCALALKILGDTKKPSLQTFVNIFKQQNDILKAFSQAQSVYESLSKYIRDNLKLLKGLDFKAFGKATDVFTNEQLRKEKYNQFKAKISTLKKQFKEWSTANEKQIAKLKSIKDAYNRELETYPLYQDFQKMSQTEAGRIAARDKYGDQISELQKKLAQKYFGGREQLSDVHMIFSYTSIVHNFLYAAEWLIRTPQYTSDTDEFRETGETIEGLLAMLHDLLKKISIKDKTASV